MSFPNSKELSRVRKKMKKIEPTQTLKSSASAVDQLKYALCKELIIYIRTQKISQQDLAAEVGIDPARISEIVKYKIDLFTVDRLLGILEQLNPRIKVTVA